MENNFNFPVEKLLTVEDPYFGPPIVINLDKDELRWRDLCRHLALWNIVPERLSAVSGVKLPAMSSAMSAAEYNASVNLSHAAASRQCLINSKRNFWLVLEDDCRFVENPKISICNILSTLQENNADWSVISLGCYSYDRQGVKEKIDYSSLPILHRPRNWYPWGAHSYIINRKYAEHVIGKWSSCLYPADHLLLSEYSSNRGYLLRPSISYQEEYHSYHSGGTGKVETKLSADMSPKMIEKICKTTILNY